MVEVHPRDTPNPSEAAAPVGTIALPAALIRLLGERRTTPPPLRLLEARGRPVEDPPPIVEPTDFEPPPPRETRRDGSPPGRSAADTPGRRPARQRFLAPAFDRVNRDAMDERERLLGERTRRRVAPVPRPTSSNREAYPRPQMPPAAPASVIPPVSAPPRRRGRTAAIVGLSLAMTLGIGLGEGAATGALRLGAVAQTVRAWFRPPAPPLAAKPPNGPAGRAAYYATRAKAGDADAQLQLAILYAKGDGVPQDFTSAATWFRAAAKQGVARAQYDLGVLYERGRGIAVDYPQAVAWYRKAADNNYALAQYNLAVAYTKGRGVAQDFRQAASWYRRAAAQGVVPAMVNLAILYEHGDGVENSPPDAYAWYRAAARRGNALAREHADDLIGTLSDVDKSRAEMIAADVESLIVEPASPATGAAETSALSPAPAAATSPVLVPGIGAAAQAPADAAHDPDTP